VSKERASQSAVTRLLKTFFGGSVQQALVALLEASDTRLSEADIRRLDSAYFSAGPGERAGRSRGFRGVDGYLYLGPRDCLLRQPIPAKIALDKEYLDELRRRAAVLGLPADAPMQPDVFLQRESGGSVFFYDAIENQRRLEMWD
jgi:hypothetical protein